MRKYGKDNEQEPVESAGGLGEGSLRFDHPAFGQISASRVQGTATLYGSDFLHRNFVTVTISRSQLCRDLSRDWHFAGKDLVEVRLSESQWATFVSSLNHGSGVPCTLTYVDGERLADIPMRTQKDAAERDLDDTLAGIMADLKGAIADIQGELGTKVSAKTRDAILFKMRAALRKVDDHLPFAARSFAEHMEAIVESAKVEVNAYVNSTVARAGLAALQGEGLLQLGSGEDQKGTD